jgi:polysaccharide deacetylase family protein (PEP-CTERM system associated)
LTALHGSIKQTANHIMLTIDVEDWFQVENLRPWFPPESWKRYSLRVERNTHLLMDALDQYPTGQKIRATFFVLGWVAEKAPGLVREIRRRGHEVASHGYNHMMCGQLNGDVLMQDLKKSKALLEDITGTAVYGYRAPNFSISDEALSAIRASGYVYDASYNNFSKHGRYGRISTAGFSRSGIATRLAENFFELPICNLELNGHVIPWGGGGYFRLLPIGLFKLGVNRILKNNGAYVLYLHPWEIDPHQPRVRQARGLSGWRHYLNLDKTHRRLSNFIRSFSDCRFVSCKQYIDQMGATQTARIMK